MKCWRTLGKQCAVIALWIALWALLAAAVRQPLLLPDPAAVLARLFALAQQAAFWQIVLFSGKYDPYRLDLILSRNYIGDHRTYGKCVIFLRTDRLNNTVVAPAFKRGR